MYHQNGYALGNVDQCRDIAEIRMQHCTFIGAFTSDLDLLISGLCVPQSCGPDFVQKLYGAFLSTQSVALVPMVKQELLCIRDEEIQYDGAFITAMYVFHR